MSETRVSVPEKLQAQLKFNCRNRCAICAIMNGDFNEKHGQIAHIDHNHSNSFDYNNLVWLCLEHHDQYDSKTSQSKNYRPDEIRMYKNQLEAYYSNSKNNELITYLTNIIQLVNDGDGYMFDFDAIEKIENFVREVAYPEKYGLSSYQQQLFTISRLLQNILNIFNPAYYHTSTGDYKLVFNIGKTPDEILEKNKKQYSNFLYELNKQYKSFINSYNGIL